MLGVFHGLYGRHAQALGAGLEQRDGVETDGLVDDDAPLVVAANDGAAPAARRLDGVLNLLEIPFVGDFIAVRPFDGYRPILSSKQKAKRVRVMLPTAFVLALKRRRAYIPD